MTKHTSKRPLETLYKQEQLITKNIPGLNTREIAREHTYFQKQKAKERIDQHISDKQKEFQFKDYVKEIKK